MTLSDSLPGGILTAERSFPSKNADFMTLRNTIVYRSPHQISHISVLTGFKVTRLSSENDSFNEVRSEKQMRL
jgi:hypothetical protein